MVVDAISSKGVEALRVTERHPLLGAEVRGLDLSQPLDAATVAAILEIWARHLVLVFPEQDLSEAAQVRFSRYFGELAVHQEEVVGDLSAAFDAYSKAFLIDTAEQNLLEDLERLAEALAVIPEVLDVAPENLVCKQRQRQTGIDGDMEDLGQHKCDHANDK